MNESQGEGLGLLCSRARECRICVGSPDGPPLRHEPRPVFQVSASATILIAGQAPGLRVHASGRPFTDASGDRLREWLGTPPEVFYDATRIAILPMGFCFPGYDAKGADLPPRRECAPAWRKEFLGHLRGLRLILAIGHHAQRWHLPKAGSLTENVRSWRQYIEMTPKVIPLPHPSWRNTGWLKRFPFFTSDVLPAVRREVAALLDKPGSAT